MSGGGHDYTNVYRDFEDIFGDFSGIFDSFFGGTGRRASGGRSRSSVQRGSDLRYDLEVEFQDAAFGTKTEIGFSRHVSCDVCSGSGSQNGGGKKTCPTCGGAGQVRRSSGFFSIASTCPSCQGEGQIIEKPCPKCTGTGLMRKNQRIKVSIPPGIENGKRISIPEQGDAGPNGGPPGDLYVFMHVKAHDYFERDGADLYCVIPIDIVQASLGADIVVDTLDKRQIKVKIPAATQSGKILRIRGEGVPHLNSPDNRGDLYLKIQVTVPKKLSSKGKTLLKEFGEAEGQEEHPKPVPLAQLREEA
jgi:molecular chaperone DnaJ